MNFVRRSCYAVFMAALVLTPVSVEAANPRGGKVTLPVMTSITVKLDEAVNAKLIANGTGFTASIKEPVQVDGVTAIPANSSAGGLVSKESATSGELQLNSVFVNGKMYRITTSPIPFNQKTSLRAGSTMTFYLVLSLNIAR
ncbi:MAG: hypothetical protein JST28_02725 [Acidobacteria bacterium]|nr:hypothetical protein [Acidobacteriota bacterium]